VSRASVDVHAFCREFRKRVMEDVRKVYTAEQIKSAWVWDTGGGRKSFEFHGPDKEYIYNLDADCKWSAEASGWSKLLAQKEEAQMKTYTVTLSADALVSGTVEIKAASPQEARAKALAMKEEDIEWEVGCLHESVKDCGTVVYLDGEEVGEAEGY
jgi:hypothetical protein